MNSIVDAQPSRVEEIGQAAASESWQGVFYVLPLFLLLFATVFSPHKPINSHNLLAVSAAEWYRPYLFGGIYLLALVTVLTQPAKAFRIASRHGVYLAFLLYVVWTANWSAYPGKVLIVWGHFVGAYLVCLAAMLSPNARQRNMVQMFSFFALVSVAATLLLVVINPDRAIMEVGGKLRWVGFTNSANMLGAVMLVAVWGCWSAFYSFSSSTARWGIMLLMPLVLVCLFKSDSMTSLLLALAISMAFPLVMRLGRLGPLHAGLILLACGVVLFVILLLLYVVAPELFSPGTVLDNLRYIGRSATFTGRTALWDTAFRAIADRPFIGWSFDSLFSVGDRYLVRASHFHNGYLELLVNGGVLGLVFMTALIVQSLFRLQHVLALDVNWGISLGLLLLLVLLHNLAEPSLGKAPTLLWVIFTMIFTVLSLPLQSGSR